MPILTLLRPRKMYDLRVGPQSYKFFIGSPVCVPQDIADRCMRIKDKGKPIFKSEPEGIDPDADVAEALGVQLRFKAFGG